MFFPPSVLPLRIWLVPSLPSAPLDLCLSVSLCVLSPRRQTGHVLYSHCNKSIQRLQNIHFYLSHPFLAVSIICVWHPFCSIESSWHPSHKQYRCISKPLETSRSLFSSNVTEWHKCCLLRLFSLVCVVFDGMCCVWKWKEEQIFFKFESGVHRD